MQKNCKQCSEQFEITDEDLKFYDKVSPVFNGKKYLFDSVCVSLDDDQKSIKILKSVATKKQFYVFAVL